MGVWAYFFNLFSIENPPPPMSVTSVMHIYDTCRDELDLQKPAHTPIVVRNTVPRSNLQYGLPEAQKDFFLLAPILKFEMDQS